MHAVGTSGTIELLEDVVRIRKHLFFGKSQGPRDILIQDIQAVAFTEAGALSNGHIQIVHAHTAKKRGLLETLDKDPDTIIFVRRDQGPFEAVRDALRSQIALPRSQGGIEQQVRALAKLKAEGLLTEEEFVAGKRKLLGIDHNP